MASEEVRDVSLFLSDLAMGLLERVVFLNSKELVGVVTCDNDYIVVLIVERALNGDHGLTLPHTLEREAFLLIPVPKDDLIAVLTGLQRVFYG
jgi:hypothetical protein